MNNFFPGAIASWNIFIKHFDDTPSFGVLKKHINNYFRAKSKSIFGTHISVSTESKLKPFNKSQVASTLLIHPLKCVSVIKVLRTQVISYSHVLST